MSQRRNHFMRSATVLGGLLSASVLSVNSTASANLLTDPSFEANALLPGIGVLTNIPGNAGIWGTENANIVGTVGAVSPAGGVKMLQMLDDGLVATQGWQAVNVSGFAGTIDAGLASYTASALYNVDSAVPAAAASTGVFFVDSTGVYGNFTGPFSSTGQVLDANPGTWQPITDAGSVPVGTRWLIIQVAYSNASLASVNGTIEPGYVDVADLDIRVPEPASLSLLALGPVLARRRRSRNQR